jgi:translation initiation factor 2 subunit 2
MDYKEMLLRGREKLPTSVLKTDRFVVPKVRGHIQGNRTVISNFSQIVEYLGREQDHVLKFILKELATPGEIKNNLFIIGSKISAERINQKIDQYANLFVICKECKRPDTKMLKQDRVTLLKCSACGAKYPINA